MIYLGVDYSSAYVYLAFLKENKLLRTQIIDLTNLSKAIEILEVMLGAEDISMYIEQPWVSSSFFPRSALMLARTAGIIEAIAVRCGIKPTFVLPNVWRKRVYGKARVENRKEAARELALELFGFETERKYQHDMAEATLIAHYGQLVSGDIIP